jgi:hypothetical protein
MKIEDKNLSKFTIFNTKRSFFSPGNMRTFFLGHSTTPKIKNNFFRSKSEAQKRRFYDTKDM